jgi:hypothetical protein
LSATVESAGEAAQRIASNGGAAEDSVWLMLHAIRHRSGGSYGRTVPEIEKSAPVPAILGHLRR